MSFEAGTNWRSSQSYLVEITEVCWPHPATRGRRRSASRSTSMWRARKAPASGPWSAPLGDGHRRATIYAALNGRV